MKEFRIYGIVVLLMIFWMGIPAGFAQKRSISNKPNKEWNRFSFEFGGYLTNINSNFRLGVDNYGIGLDIDFEEALGLETASLTFNGNFRYRFSRNRRHVISARYFQIIRNSSKVIQADIEINDRIFKAGTELSSSFSIGVMNIDYGYSFLMDDRINIKASFGFFVMPVKISLGRDDDEAEQTDFVAPLPALGIESLYKLSKKFTLRQAVHLFYLSINNHEGGMLDFNVLLEYNIIPHLGLGLGYNSFSIDVTQKKNATRQVFGDLVGKLEYKHSGILLFGFYTF